MNILRLPALLAAAVLLAACGACDGSKMCAVKGKILYQGQPAKGAMAIFHLKGGNINSPMPTGFAGEDGSFELETQDKKGAPRGVYKVTFTWNAPVKDAGKPMGLAGGDNERASAKNRFEGTPYASAEATPVSVEIKGDQTLEAFDLK